MRFRPCIPTRGTKVPDRPEWIHEIKHDGYRLIVQRDGKRVRLFTRNGHDWSGRFPLIVEAALRQPEQLLRDRWRGGAARRRRPSRLQRPALAQARCRGPVLRLRYAGQRRRGSPELPLSMRKTNLARLLARRVDGIFLSTSSRARSVRTCSGTPA